jgi:energy-converting hydrogenase Eha subunit B
VNGPVNLHSVSRRAIRAVSGWRPGVYLFIAVTCLYFASMSREVPWGDARAIYDVAESMVNLQGVSVPVRWPSDAPPGRNGKFYAAQPFIPSLLHLPGAALRSALWHLHPGPELEHLSAVFACHLAGTLLGGLVAWLFFCLCLRHGASPPLAGLAAILLATTSIVWVYARSPFSEITQIAGFTGFFLEFTKLVERPDRRTALLAGLWAGLLLNTKYIYALSFPGALLLVVLAHRKALRSLAAPLLSAALGFLPGLLMALLYNYLRFGSIMKTGYAGIGNVMVENVLVSLWGFLFSPGKSLFLYTPALVLAVLGFPGLWRSHRWTVLAMLATIGPVILLYCCYPAWPGDWAWGPRYAVFAIPVLLLPVISFFSSARRTGRSLAVALLAVGLCVQLLGNAFYWDHFIRIGLDARTKWLGQPNRSASVTADKGGYCEGCFEDTYPTVWLGPFQPILGHLWLMRHVPFGHDWKRASQDAPWRRHTRLNIDAKATYERARMDHWLYETRKYRIEGWIVLLLLLGAGTGAGVLFVRRTREDGELSLQ